MRLGTSCGSGLHARGALASPSRLLRRCCCCCCCCWWLCSHSSAFTVTSGTAAETAAGAAVADSADDRRDGAPMSDGACTMSVQLVLCVADSVWHAAGYLLARRVCMPPAHSHRAAPAQMLLLLLAVLSFHCRHSQLQQYRDRSW